MFINYEHNNHIYYVVVEQRNNQFYVSYNNTEYTVSATELKPGQLEMKLGERIIKSVISEGEESKFVFLNGSVYQVKRIELSGRKRIEKKEGDLNSPISGTVVSVKVEPGTKVKKDDVIMVIEAMKMEYLIRAPYDGVVAKINFKEKEQIEIGQITAEVTKSEEA